MKKIFFVLAIPFLMITCNDRTESSTEENTVDSGSNTSSMNADSAGKQSPSAQLSASMNKMMQQMKDMTPTGDADNDFAMMMMIHHQGAVDMSQVQMSNGMDTALVSIAKHIDSTSRNQIAELDSFLTKNKPDTSASKEKSEFAAKSMQMMDTSAVMTMSSPGTVDRDFANMMIHHHHDGIEMSRLYVKTANAAQTRKIANEIIRDQPKEIKKLEKFNDK